MIFHLCIWQTWLPGLSRNSKKKLQNVYKLCSHFYRVEKTEVVMQKRQIYDKYRIYSKFKAYNDLNEIHFIFVRNFQTIFAYLKA